MTDGHGFHRFQSVSALPDAGLEIAIEAKPSERQGLAKFLDVQALGALRAKLLLQRWRGPGARLTGTIQADVTQTCVVTLEPLTTRLNLEIDRKFLPETMLDRDADPHELLIDPEGEDPPEPLPHALDLGDLVAEEVALNLDPYPRKEGIAAPAEAAPDDAAAPSRAENPFSALKKILKT